MNEPDAAQKIAQKWIESATGRNMPRTVAGLAADIRAAIAEAEQRGREAERADIVARLRHKWRSSYGHIQADRIERGEHTKGEP